ncbi:hypothetical protein GCM10023328_46600 [Modestobacter marinus]|uniref:Uncharacterized protein n=1 Tax=Modestobacter marinus TaxID=477641 RepID=A0ABQ2GAS6_9ACTN|nr:hypothetical protein GCM10011589_45170 [Modestobacter marinus]
MVKNGAVEGMDFPQVARAVTVDPPSRYMSAWARDPRSLPEPPFGDRGSDCRSTRIPTQGRLRVVGPLARTQ